MPTIDARTGDQVLTLEEITQHLDQADVRPSPEAPPVPHAVANRGQGQNYDLVGDVEQTLVSLLAGDDSERQASIQNAVLSMREEHGYATATPLERLLIEVVVQSWLFLQHAHLLYGESSACSLPQARFLMARQASCQQRHLAAIQMLVNVRRLLARAPGRQRNREVAVG